MFKRKMTATVEELRHMYWTQRMSTRQIAEKYGVIAEAVRRWMVKYSIPRRGRYEATLKYFRKPFFGSECEKAYLLGLRAGDIHARKRATNTIGVNVSTTSPAMIELFENTFGKYGFVKKYPAKGPLVYEWYVYCDLDTSFEFLVEKPAEVPKNNDGFYAFLAGYVDSEGTWTFGYQNGHPRPNFWIKSQDIELLNGIKRRLKDDGFHPRGPNLVIKSGTIQTAFLNGGSITIKNRKDYCKLSLYKQAEIIQLAKRLVPFSRHREKVKRMLFVFKVGEGRLIKKEVMTFIESGKRKIKECVKASEKEYLRRHPSAIFPHEDAATWLEESKICALPRDDECYCMYKMK